MSESVFETVFPPEIIRRGKGMLIRHGWRMSVYGPVHVGISERGLCWIGLETRQGQRADSEKRIRAWWPAARFEETRVAVLPDIEAQAGDVSLDLYGTAFQLQVWRALVKIPCGQTSTYAEVARAIGHPMAARAVGRAVGANPVSILVPCHRVLPASGYVGQYGWGAEVKRRLLDLEKAQYGLKKAS